MPTARLVPLAVLLVLGVGSGAAASADPAAPAAAAPAPAAAKAVDTESLAPSAVVRPAANSWTRKARTSVRRVDSWTGTAPTVVPAANSWTRKARTRALVVGRVLA